jgi:hypothetical protein
MTENGEAPVFQEDDQGTQRTGQVICCVEHLCFSVVTILQVVQ